MPLLKYRCSECGKVFEELVRGTENEKVRCPECGSENAERFYRGKCSFGKLGSGGCTGNCATCSGCGGH